MTRVLQALAGAETGGAELHFVRLCLALHKAGVEEHVVMRPHRRREDELKAGGVVPILAPFGGWFDFRTRFILKRELRRFKPEIVLTYMNRASKKMPKGGHVHIGRLGGYYNLKYYKRCDHLVCITPDIVDYCVKSGWPTERVHCIPNFVEDNTAPAADRRSYGTPTAVPLVFALGRLHENKAFDTLLRAIAALPGTYLWLAGDGPELDKLKTLARELGIADRVHLLGWIDDPAPLFAAADVFVVPSRHEPLGSVLLEGWMHRKPMIAAASQGPKFLIKDGEDGLLVPIDEPAAMAAAIGRVLDDPALARSLARKGRATFEANYTEAVAVSRYLALFDKVLADKQAKAKDGG